MPDNSRPNPEPQILRNYVTRPETVRALHFTESTPEITGPAIAAATGGTYSLSHKRGEEPRHFVELPGVFACVNPGDYLILQADGTYRRVSPAVFNIRYTPEEDSPWHA